MYEHKLVFEIFKFNEFKIGNYGDVLDIESKYYYGSV